MYLPACEKKNKINLIALQLNEFSYAKLDPCEDNLPL